METLINEISELVQKKINTHGELHLDAVQSNILFSWLKKTELLFRDYEKVGKGIEELVKKL